MPFSHGPNGSRCFPEKRRLKTMKNDHHHPPPSCGWALCLEISPQKPHLYARAVEVSGTTSYDMVPSVATQAPAALSPHGALEATPIPRSCSSPALHADTQVMSPNCEVGFWMFQFQDVLKGCR